MCDFEDWPVIAKYTVQDALADGVLVSITTHQGKPVVATAHIAHEVTKPDLEKLFRQFLHWDKTVRPGLPEEEQLFMKTVNNRTVWIMEDSEAYTIMYPEDY